MITSKTFVKKTRKGSVLKVVREHYLRDDIWCGSSCCVQCSDPNPSLEKQPKSFSTLCTEPHYLIPDTNVVLHQMDVLEDPVFQNVIILQTVLQEVRHRHSPIYGRIKEVMTNKERHFHSFTNEHHKETYVERKAGESANDRNDRAIRVAAKWYSEHLGSGVSTKNGKVNVVLLTNDNENLAKAEEMGLTVHSFSDYVKSLNDHPHLLDKLAQLSNENGNKGSEFMKCGKKYLYPEHLSLSQLQAGIKSGKFVQGKFQRSQENYLEGFIFVDDNESNMILLQGREHISRAVHNDVVAVELLPKDRWSHPSSVVLQDESVNPDDDEDDKKDEMLIKRERTKAEPVPTGRVVGIIRRNWRSYCGILQASPIKEATRHLFLPSEKRIPKIRVETRQGVSLKKKLIVVAIDGWSRESRYPHGHYVRILGDIGDKEAENEVLLLEHDIPHQNFSQSVLACLPKLPWVITEEDEKVRVDLRHLAVCSVDPPGCTDIDDALHCRKLPNGNFEVGVHIADVSHFIKPGTAIDKEASNRGTTVYLVDKRIDMVPDLLSSNLCSLREKEDRFAFSCIWEMTPQAEILKTNFYKSIICSRAALTYMEAQLKIDDHSVCDELTESLRSLNSIAKILKKQRIENGALTLASSEVRFLVDSETHDPIDVQSKELKETNSMVEEFMLLANISVAHKILEEFPECAVLRRHPEPPPANFDPLIKIAEFKGFDINVETGKALADSLDKAVISNNLYFNMMLRMVATRCMTQALYFCSGMVAESDYPHYGLAVPLYTHFTSPIRRYSDVLVHRLLAAAIGADTTYPELLDKIKIQTTCNNLNYRHRMGQYAGRASVNLYTHMFFKDHSIDEEGYILFVRENALQILLPRFGMEASLFLKPSNGSPGPVAFHYNDKELSQTGAGVKLRQFDPVIVRVSIDSSNIQHQKVKLELVKPEIPGFSVSPTDPCQEPVKKKAKT